MAAEDHSSEVSRSEWSPVEKLRFYRDEIKHEFNLIAVRSTILVTCQSFLVVPYAILQTVGNFRAALVSIFLVAGLGIFVAAILIQPIQAGHRTLNKWLLKQRRLIKETEALRELAIDRDLHPGSETDLKQDRDHVKSLAFSQYSPWAFIIFWLAASLYAVIRFRWGL